MIENIIEVIDHGIQVTDEVAGELEVVVENSQKNLQPEI